MTPPRSPSSLQAELRYEFRSEYQRVRANYRSYLAILSGIAIVFALVAFFKLDYDVARFPLLLVAGTVHALQYIGLYALVCAFVVAKLVYETTHGKLEASWTEKESRRRPGQSFAVAYWRFLLVAAPTAVATFLALALCIALAFFWLPLQFDPLAEVLHAMTPDT